ncbi:DUF4255 domain-containing protein [Aggregatimonas sangjinii]|uniref:DUF4255 domain-containing protein n=1 Tax=Aggregatimonas sangjinii TaxID=2583587 RepID=A0A5B7SQI9_9FLAO|nr:DUF4255 domain-containing protein [Aggregatimonas sangjinii]QCX00955.1 DUF4255 domain-containing protein [Aggregatimonas sangjinii]
MISKALSFIEEQTDLYLQGLLGASTQKYAVLGNIARIVDSGEGSETEDASGVIITLVNIEEDLISKNPDGVYRNVDQVVKTNPKILVNLYVLFSVNLNTYTTALSRISNVIQCFQSTNYFTQASFPSLDPGIEKLHLELYTMNFEQVNHLWSTLGGKYLPSVLYKMRMVVIADEANQVGGGLIREIQMEKNVLSGTLN